MVNLTLRSLAFTSLHHEELKICLQISCCMFKHSLSPPCITLICIWFLSSFTHAYFLRTEQIPGGNMLQYEPVKQKTIDNQVIIWKAFALKVFHSITQNTVFSSSFLSMPTHCVPVVPLKKQNKTKTSKQYVLMKEAFSDRAVGHQGTLTYWMSYWPLFCTLVRLQDAQLSVTPLFFLK